MAIANPRANDLGFDPDALREKYRRERDKRMRPDGMDQYVEIEGDYAGFVDDPYVDPDFTREPIEDEIDVALIGGGFGGLLAGARLRELGVERLRIIEKGGDVGGTWYFNRYPGVACDIESYVYIPLLEELDYLPREKYSRGDEIWAHCRAIAERYDLYRDACLQTEVKRIDWEEGARRWRISTNHGDAIRARFIYLANGFLQKPKLPGIPGILDFEGAMFHTSRWDYAYTGGDANGNLDGLRDKRVGIIGTGASAVQCVPHLGRDAQQLYVFQRTPSSIDVRANRPTDPSWTAGLEPGWQQRRIDNFQTLTAGGVAEEDLVGDGWTDISKKLLAMMLAEDGPEMTPEAAAEAMELADFAKMEEIRARVDEIVEDPATAESLKPYYRQFCKRPCFHDEYLQTFNRPNVTLVDTQGQSVERVTKTGVVANGREYELDCLIFATGFEVGTDFSSRSGYEVAGVDGVTLSQAHADGMRSLHGMHMHGFPNCFVMSTYQSGFTVNFPYILDIQAKHLAHIVDRALREDITRIEVSREAERAWVDAVVAQAERMVDFNESCTPGYYNNEGFANAKTRKNGFYFGEPMEFVELLEAWRADGRMPGLACRSGEEIAPA